MILEAARKHSLDLTRSWMIGDSPKDVEAGRAAGCRTILVNPAATPDLADFTFNSMADLKANIAKIV